MGMVVTQRLAAMWDSRKTRKKSNLGPMTSGNVYRQIILFGIPLLLSNVFQLLYNTTDSVVVGNFANSIALAAVGASTPIINLFINFFVGLSAGAGVVIATYYGAKDAEMTGKAVHTFMLFSVLTGVLFSILGLTSADGLLKWIAVPRDVFPQAHQYLSCYFVGNVFVIICNAGTGILQAVGDSRHPLYYLGASAVINIALDVLFVGSFAWGVAGAAWATVISQAISMALVLHRLICADDSYRIVLSNLRISWRILKRIIWIGVPAGAQQVIVSFSNVLVQSYVNSFGSAAIAGYAASNKFDILLIVPANSFGIAAMTFTGQNIGARKFERVREGIRASIVVSAAAVIAMSFVTFFGSDWCISLFSQDQSVIDAGAKLLRITSPFYFLLCFHQVFTGVLRATGRSYAPMVTATLSYVVYRQVLLAVMLPIVHDTAVIGWGFSSAWVIGTLLVYLYYRMSKPLEKEQAKYRPGV